MLRLPSWDLKATDARRASEAALEAERREAARSRDALLRLQEALEVERHNLELKEGELERLRADRSRERRSDDVAAPARPRPTTCANALMVVVFFLSGGVLGGGAGGALE